MVAYMNDIKADAEAGKPVPGGRMGELYTLWQQGRYDPAKQDPFSNYITESGDNPDAFNTSLGLFAQYDTRDVTFNASKGIFIKAEAKWYPEWLGNTRRSFGRFTLTFDFYQNSGKAPSSPTTSTPTSRPAPRRGTCTPRWAAWNACAATTKGATATKTCRDADRAAPEIYRRHGIVAWIGGGQVWGTDKFRWDNTLYSFGCGYRFEFKNRMNIRLDYGWGVYGNQNLPWDRKRSSAFLFTASEAF